MRVIGFVVEDDEGSEKVVDLHSEWVEANLPAQVQMDGILQALRYILEVPEAGSILYQASKMMRRYKQSWPPKNLNILPEQAAYILENPPRDGFPELLFKKLQAIAAEVVSS